MADPAKVAELMAEVEGAESAPVADANAVPPADAPVAEVDSAISDTESVEAPKPGSEEARAVEKKSNEEKIQKALKIEEDKQRWHRQNRARQKPPGAQTPQVDPAEVERRFQEKLARQFSEDPVGAMRALGLDPAKTYENTTARILQMGTPEEKLRESLRQEFRDELAKRDKAIEDQQTAIRRQQAAARNQDAVARFGAEFESAADKYPLLDQKYSTPKVLDLAERAMQEYFDQFKVPFNGTFSDILEYLETRELHESKAVEARRSKRTGTQQGSTAEVAPGGRPSSTLTNGIASRRASVPASTGFSRDAERERLIAELEAQESRKRRAS